MKLPDGNLRPAIVDTLYNFLIKKSKDNFKLSEELRKQNQNLKETRDLLILRLVSGDLDVESLDLK